MILKESELLDKVYQEDNLSFMKKLPSAFIDLIYCDILYGTGKGFGDYKDIKADRNIVNEFYIPRFQEMHRILKDTGSIYIHCDWRINHWVRLILDDIFGYNNFVNEIIWCYEKSRPAKYMFKRVHDVIYFYQKKINKNFNIQYVERKEKKEKKYKTQYEGKICPSWWIDIPSFATCMTSKERTGYQTQKPKALLERIIKASSSKGDIVADFFCGSGTTLVVAKELGRKYIGCDIEKGAVQLTEDRLQKVRIGFNLE